MITKIACFIVNTLSLFLFRGEYLKFYKNRDVKRVQKDKLFEILRRNRECEYGKKYNFKNINSIEEFQNRVPIAAYENYSEYIEKMKKGEKNILTSEEVILFEPTSGSTAPSKLIPYTKELKSEFQKGIKVWLYHLYSENSGVRAGKSYWSITPAVNRKKKSEGGIPIGFEEDGEYFGKIEKKLIDYVMAVPPSVIKSENMEEFYYKTALSLLKCEELTLISVWHPTYLLLILDYMESNREKLCRELKKSIGGKIEEFLRNREFQKIWKNLKVISCWCDGNAEIYSKKIRDIFPKTVIEPKGLISTEFFTSFPIKGKEGSVLSIHSHFFEFLSLKDGKIYLTDEIKKDERYVVIATGSGGFYRYDTGDIVEITGKYGEIPLIKFIGKNDKISDIFGEKLSEGFIRTVMESCGIRDEFYMVAFEKERYVLYLKSNKTPVNIDEKLRESFHYDYCRKLGQLKELKIMKLSGNPEKDYIDECVRSGQKLGDIKITNLSKKSGWDKIFKGDYI